MVSEMFQFEDALRVVSPLGIIVSFLVGIIVGWVVVRGIDVESVVSSLVQVGMPFFLSVAVTRFAEGIERWEAWLGVGLLYAVYVVGLTIGFWSRRRSGRLLR
jgi:hypothetical protein